VAKRFDAVIPGMGTDGEVACGKLLGPRLDPAGLPGGLGVSPDRCLPGIVAQLPTFSKAHIEAIEKLDP
jgi:hypothetical protein